MFCFTNIKVVVEMELYSKVKYGELLNLYGGLLTEKQLRRMEEYFLYDLSLTEIAENSNSSRQAVYDALQKTIALLDDFEDKLKLLEKQKELNNFAKTLDISSEKKAKLLEIINR